MSEIRRGQSGQASVISESYQILTFSPGCSNLDGATVSENGQVEVSLDAPLGPQQFTCFVVVDPSFCGGTATCARKTIYEVTIIGSGDPPVGPWFQPCEGSRGT